MDFVLWENGACVKNSIELACVAFNAVELLQRLCQMYNTARVALSAVEKLHSLCQVYNIGLHPETLSYVENVISYSRESLSIVQKDIANFRTKFGDQGSVLFDLSLQSALQDVKDVESSVEAKKQLQASRKVLSRLERNVQDNKDRIKTIIFVLESLDSSLKLIHASLNRGSHQVEAPHWAHLRNLYFTKSQAESN